MEIEIISNSTGRASRFTKFLDDELVIPSNSSIHLNHATLVRPQTVVLDNDETITLVLPESDTFGGSSVYIDQSIAAGEYTSLELFNQVKTSLEDIQSGTSISNSYDVHTTFDNDGVPIKIGYLANYNNTYIIDQASYDSSGISVGTSKDADFNTVIQSAGTSVGGNACFFTHPNKYFHGVQEYQYSGGDETDIFSDEAPQVIWNFIDDQDNELTQTSLLQMQTDSGTSAQFSFGFYSDEYGNDDTVGTGLRTNDTTVVSVPSGQNMLSPTLFVGCNLRTEGTKVFADAAVGYNSTDEECYLWDDQNKSIDEVRSQETSDLSTIITDADATIIPHATIYYNAELGLYCWAFGFEDGNGDVKVLYDSSNYQLGFTESFFNGLGYSTEILKRSQLLNPFFSSNIVDSECKMSFSGLSSTNSIIQTEPGYYLEVGPTIAKFFNNYSGTTPVSLHDRQPNALTEDAESIDSSVRNSLYSWSQADIFSRDSYAIRLKNFPIRVNKTNENKDQKGYTQPILAIIPTPFAEFQPKQLAEITRGGEIVGKYEAKYPQHKDLKNQEFVVNRFDIEVTNLLTDKLATEIDNVTLNFTINPPTTAVEEV